MSSIAFGHGAIWTSNRQYTARCRSATTPRACATTPPNDKNMTKRELEIAAKIQRLRRLRKLPSQRNTENADVAGEQVEPKDGTSRELETKDGEEMFANTIAKGEALFGTGRNGGTTSSGSGEKYSPKVSTWGLYPRPENISRTFGGGRTLPVGGEGNKQSTSSRAYDERVAKKLAKYRGGSIAETALEESHAEEIEGAMEEAKEMMVRGYGYDATRVLRPMLQYATVRSRRGGELRLALALACEECGRRSEAREIYGKLMKENRFNDIRQKVKRLNAGFADMEKMRISDDSQDGVMGFRSSDFYIPDLAALDKRRFHGTGLNVQMSSEEKRKEAVWFAAILGLLIALPAAAVLLLWSLA